jgi:FAD/FMN-containing dehydrogenase
VIWIEVVEAAAEHGLAALAGSSPDVGVVGYTLGGGLSWLVRKYGLAANKVTAVELVTADGRLVRADRDNEPDLFWALRGGGGSFGVVTALEFRLYPLTEVYAGVMFWPVERAAEVLNAWREWTATVPDEMTSVGRILQLPPLPDVPEPLRGRSFARRDLVVRRGVPVVRRRDHARPGGVRRRHGRRGAADRVDGAVGRRLHVPQLLRGRHEQGEAVDGAGLPPASPREGAV